MRLSITAQAARALICRWFGHSFSKPEVLTLPAGLRIMVVTCSRCGHKQRV